MLAGFWGSSSPFASRGLGIGAAVALGSLVWWPGVLPAGWCETAVSVGCNSHREHSRQRQSLINTLNHLCFDLNPDSTQTQKAES